MATVNVYIERDEPLVSAEMLRLSFAPTVYGVSKKTGQRGGGIPLLSPPPPREDFVKFRLG